MTGIDLMAVYATAKILEIDMSPGMLRKIKALEVATLKQQQTENRKVDANKGHRHRR